jgi:hypothetical protein
MLTNKLLNSVVLQRLQTFIEEARAILYLRETFAVHL